MIIRSEPDVGQTVKRKVGEVKTSLVTATHHKRIRQRSNQPSRPTNGGADEAHGEAKKAEWRIGRRHRSWKTRRQANPISCEAGRAGQAATTFANAEERQWSNGDGIEQRATDEKNGHACDDEFDKQSTDKAFVDRSINKAEENGKASATTDDETDGPTHGCRRAGTTISAKGVIRHVKFRKHGAVSETHCERVARADDEAGAREIGHAPDGSRCKRRCRWRAHRRGVDNKRAHRARPEENDRPLNNAKPGERQPKRLLGKAANRTQTRNGKVKKLFIR